MKKILIFVFMSVCTLAYSQPTQTVKLYPQGQNSTVGNPVVSTLITGPEVETDGKFSNIGDDARFDLYLPARPNGLMVVVCPGGGYVCVCADHEGEKVAKWLNERNIACCVLKYRLPNGHCEAPLADVQNTFRYCREHASQWGINKIGVMGFSAGGHLAASASTLYTDEITRPDFSILIYPVVGGGAPGPEACMDWLIGRKQLYDDRSLPYNDWEKSMETYAGLRRRFDTPSQIDANTPPAFLAASQNDRAVPYRQCVRYFSSLNAKKVPAELHLYPQGDHGWGWQDTEDDILKPYRTDFYANLERWLLEQEYGKDVVAHTGGKRHKAKQTVLLYPQGQDSNEGVGGSPLESNGIAEEETLNEKGSLSKVGDNARFDLYFPQKPNGKMIIVCPGGGYSHLATFHEGTYLADWLLERGISVCVLKYRMPNGHWMIPLTDVQNTFRYCRANAARWKIDKIGVMGFSAGGHLAACASTLFSDEITRPDFSVLIYPVISMGELSHSGSKNNLMGAPAKWDDKSLPVDDYLRKMDTYHKLGETYSPENHVDANTPPTFMAVSANDALHVHSLIYYDSLSRSGVPAELHVYPYGGHGWGFLRDRTLGEGKCSFDYARNAFDTTFTRFLDNL